TLPFRSIGQRLQGTCQMVRPVTARRAAHEFELSAVARIGGDTSRRTLRRSSFSSPLGAWSATLKEFSAELGRYRGQSTDSPRKAGRSLVARTAGAPDSGWLCSPSLRPESSLACSGSAYPVTL